MRLSIRHRLVVLIPLIATALAKAAGPTTMPPADGPSAAVRLWPGDGTATRPLDDGDRVELRGRREAPDVWVMGVTSPGLAVYLPDAAGDAVGRAPATATIVIPGGGYAGEAYSHEGSDIARALARQGIAAFVLKYRLPDGRTPGENELPVPQQDVLRAIQLVRHDAAKFGVDPKRVGVIGFSAGGHLAATAATLYGDAPVLAAKAGDDAVSKTSARPDFAVLAYPVITMDVGKSHSGSRDRLLGRTPPADVVRRFSVEERVTNETPPLFVFHAEDDGIVPVANARLIADAARAKGVPCELLVFKTGGHGFGLGRPGTEAGVWFGRMGAWLKAGKLLD